MQRVRFAVLLLVLTWQAGSNSGSVAVGRRPKSEWDSQAFQKLRETGLREFRARNYREAAAVFEQGYRQAMRRGDRASAIRFLNNAAGCRFATFQYQEALDAYVQARTLAEELHDGEAAAAAALNLAGLYLQMSDHRLAIQSAQRGLQWVGDRGDARVRSQLLLRLAVVLATGLQDASAGRQDPFPLFREGLRLADQTGDTALQARALDGFGYALLRAGRLAEAEAMLLEAFRLRRLRQGQDVPASYLKLGMLAAAQGRTQAADALLSLALRQPDSSAVPHLVALQERGKVRERLGRPQEALRDYRDALRIGSAWRQAVVGAEALRVSSESALHEAAAGFVRLAAASGTPDLIRQAFGASEQGRYAFWNAVERPSYPSAYYETLDRLRSAETRLLQADTPENRARAAALGLELAELEGGLAVYPTHGALQAVVRSAQERLGAGEALLSFFLDEKESFLWAVTRQDLRLCRLPGRRFLAGLAESFRDAVQQNRPELVETGRQLYRTLLGCAEPVVRAKRDWALVLDRELFQAPLSALVVNPSGPPVYLAERHALRLVPSAARLREPGGAGPDPQGFLGVGDLVYNRADPRLRVSGAPFRLMTARAGTDPAGPELARLSGSAREIRTAAQALGATRAVLLTGTRSGPADLRDALAANPSVVHLATHIVASGDDGHSAAVALGIEHGLLTAADIAALRTQADLVALSGCASGRGRAVPGIGLLGLTRAWLRAGARAVLASLWPTPDDSGELFEYFYGAMRVTRSRPHLALQHAQIEVLRSQTWRSEPRYWAAYFVLGKD